MTKAKYIKTKSGDIIVFSAAMMHSEFKHYNPISAGFIDFYINNEGNPTCSCFGESISLGLISDEEEDTRLARIQLGLIFY